MARRKPMTQLQKEYQKQRRRIQQFVRRAEKRGFEFDKNIVPQMPKRVTQKALEKITKLRPNELYQEARYGGEATGGEIVAGTEGRKEERKRSAEKALQTRKLREAEKFLSEQGYDLQQEDFDYNDYYQNNEQDFTYEETTASDTSFYDRVIISNFRAQAQYFYNKAVTDMVHNWVDNCIARFGEHDTAQMIQSAGEAGMTLGTLGPSASQEKVSTFLGEMLNYMHEAGDFTQDQMMEALEAEEFYEPLY